MAIERTTNGNYRQKTVREGQGVLIASEEIHKVTFQDDNTVVKAFLFPPIDSDLPEQGEVQEINGFTITGVYSDKDVKVVMAKNGKQFPKHRHPGKEWIEVIRGKVVVYHYRELLAMGMVMFSSFLIRGV